MRTRGLSMVLLISLFRILFVAGVYTQCLDDQRFLLLQLKSSLVFDSTYSTKLVNWNQSDDCCKWNGVDCNGAGHVISLNLENETISGVIDNSSALFRLQHLERLNLAFNIFNKTHIPNGIKNLTNLSYLNLSNAGFGGQVPTGISTMNSLVTLDLSTLFGWDQPLKLEIPNLQRLVQNLAGLRELYLDGVIISAEGNEWCHALSSSLPNLTVLSLRGCGLSGPLDSSLARLHSLSTLHIDGNNLSTTVPEFMAEFPNLTSLSLGNCFLQGAFPDIIFQVPTLQNLDLSHNVQLSGTIPNLPVSSSLRTMVLSYTSFSGPLPDSIGNLKMLSWIDLTTCKFSGSIPTTISNLTELFYVDFSLNSFNGSMPHFSKGTKLTFLDLSHNFLADSLSSNAFEGLSHLEYINIMYNSLNGSIPPSLFALPSLKNLLLSNNKFSGHIAGFSMSNTSILGIIDLSSNQLEGSIPEAFLKLEGLVVLSLSSNLFNGTFNLERVQRLPSLSRLELGYNKLCVDTSNLSLSMLPQLNKLNLASCNLSNFPDLRNQSILTFLDLSNNHIAGEIPSWIWTVGDGSLNHLNLSSNLLVGLQKPVTIPPSLSVVDLHSNQLQGELPMAPGAVYVDYSSNKFQHTIPPNLGDFFSTAIFFSLANNNLSGPIPKSHCGMTYLQVLDLSNNNLNGSIPNCLLSSYSLAVLNLRRNNINGDIPDAFSSTCVLKTLDLSQNSIGGKVPPTMANCTYLEVLNVGNNKIDDVFPCILKSCSSLRVLVLRRNKFHGEIRCSEVNENWPILQIIDIALNNFSGELNLQSIASWRGMMLDNGPQLRGDHILFQVLSNLYYQDNVAVTIKGQELELVKILTIFTAIDFSSNNFRGDIPKRVGDLTSLYLLNLSHNSFSGAIPSSIGNLKQLGSLDLSVNQLTGIIPKELTYLYFLSFLNLSYNKLVGMIPIGSQFQTFSASNFEGNSGLCGFPSNTSCDPKGNSETSLDKREYDWQLIIICSGYVVGLMVVFVPIALCKQWREYYSNQLDRFLSLIFPSYGYGFTNSRDNYHAVFEFGRRRV